MTDLENELSKIGKIIRSAHLLEEIRSQVRKELGDKQAMVLGGKYATVKDSSKYDVVIVHKEGSEFNQKMARRLKAMLSNVEVAALDGIVDNVIGIKSRDAK